MSVYTRVQVFVGARGTRSPGAGVTGGHKAPHMSSGTQAQVLSSPLEAGFNDTALRHSVDSFLSLGFCLFVCFHIIFHFLPLI